MQRISKIVLLTFLSISYFSARAQTIGGQPSDVWESHISDPILSNYEGNSLKKNQVRVNDLYRTKDDYLRAIKLNEKAKSNLESSLRAKYMYNLGICYYAIGKYQLSMENLDSCLIVDFNNELNEKVRLLKIKLGLDTLFSKWTIKESKHFIFHFQGTTTEDIVEYIKKKEYAFEEINDFFKSNLPKKITYFVWVYPEQAKKILKHRLSFASPLLSLTHTQFNSSIGHEMTHVISNYSTQISNKNKIIYEGIAVYFDLSGKDYFNLLRLKTNQPIPIVSVWKNPLSTNEYIQYYLGAELVNRLIANFGRKKFIKFFADQSYENAFEVYGKKLDDMLDKFQFELDN